MVKSGDFDRLLLRPRSAALQLAGQELTLRRVGRVGLSVYFGPPSPYNWCGRPASSKLVLAALLGGACLVAHHAPAR